MVGALHSYFCKEPPVTSTIDDLPPWRYTAITTNKTTKLCRREQPAPTSDTTVPEGYCVLYTDAALLPHGGRTAFVSSTHSALKGSRCYSTDTPDPLLLELQAVYDAIKAASALPNIKEAHIYTDSLSAVKHLKQLKKTPLICQHIHSLHMTAQLMVRVHWVQGHGNNFFNQLADNLSHSPAPPESESAPSPLPSDPRSRLLAMKSLLRRDTRALIPPCVCSLPPNLSRVEEVSLRRLRAGVALTPSVTWTWGHSQDDPGTCPKCPSPAVEADAKHLLWTCAGTRTARDDALRKVGLRWDKPDDYNRWVQDDKYCRSLMDFLHATGLHAYV